MKKITFVRLKLSKTNHLLCKARLNGTAAVLLIDTGASSSCIHSALQEQFNLEINGKSFDAAGAGEGKMKATQTKKCALHL